MSAGLVEVHGVHKSFGTLEVLAGIDLTVQPGEVAVIIGPSGSGKSTLLRTINHLEKVDRGFVAVDGELVGYERRGDTPARAAREGRSCGSAPGSASCSRASTCSRT